MIGSEQTEALFLVFDAFSSRQPASTSLETLQVFYFAALQDIHLNACGF
jgi:hypothetical protein